LVLLFWCRAAAAPKKFLGVPLALYHELSVFRDAYRLTLRIHQLTQGFFGQFRRVA
jgi:hypothetical protein